MLYKEYTQENAMDTVESLKETNKMVESVASQLKDISNVLREHLDHIKSQVKVLV